MVGLHWPSLIKTGRPFETAYFIPSQSKWGQSTLGPLAGVCASSASKRVAIENLKPIGAKILPIIGQVQGIIAQGDRSILAMRLGNVSTESAAHPQIESHIFEGQNFASCARNGQVQVKCAIGKAMQNMHFAYV